MSMFDFSSTSARTTARDRLADWAGDWLRPSRGSSLPSLTSWSPTAPRSSFWPFASRTSSAEAWIASLGDSLGQASKSWGNSGWGRSGWSPSRRSGQVSMDDIAQALASLAPRRRRPAIGALALIAGVGIAAMLLSKR